ncbi:MAG: hypothetical protein KDE55_16370 [Novosphingobium sp.]|nr:hypothetical protein [Novosphingobium sp.]
MTRLHTVPLLLILLVGVASGSLAAHYRAAGEPAPVSRSDARQVASPGFELLAGAD